MEVVLALVAVGVCGSLFSKACRKCNHKEHMTKQDWESYFIAGGDV